MTERECPFSKCARTSSTGATAGRLCVLLATLFPLATPPRRALHPLPAPEPMPATPDATPEEPVRPPVPLVERRAALLLAVLFPALLGVVWIFDHESPIETGMEAFSQGLKFIRSRVAQQPFFADDAVNALIGALCGLLTANMVLGVQALLRAAGRVGFLPGRTFWWWTIAHGAISLSVLGAVVGIFFSKGAFPVDGIIWRLATGYGAELLIAGYVLRRLHSTV